MTTPCELQRLITLSVVDATYEPYFLRALLEAELYVHLPLTDDSGRLRLVVFNRPDGVQVIPVFSDLERARRAAGSAARIASMRGRDLFAGVPGATWMLDPNDTSTTLYPEEVRALLATGRASVAPRLFQTGRTQISPSPPEDRWLAEVLASALGPIAAAQAAHVVRGHHPVPESVATLLIIVAIAPEHAERAARAVALMLENCGQSLRVPVDLGTYDPAAPPSWVGDPGFEPLWERTSTPDAHRV